MKVACIFAAGLVALAVTAGPAGAQSDNRNHSSRSNAGGLADESLRNEHIDYGNSGLDGVDWLVGGALGALTGNGNATTTTSATQTTCCDQGEGHDVD